MWVERTPLQITVEKEKENAARTKQGK